MQLWRVSASSSPLSNKLRLQSKVATLSAQGFVVFPIICFAHWVFIINVNKLEGHPLFSLPSLLENGPNYWGHGGNMSDTQSQLWLKITLELDTLQEVDIDVAHFYTQGRCTVQPVPVLSSCQLLGPAYQKQQKHREIERSHIAKMFSDVYWFLWMHADVMWDNCISKSLELRNVEGVFLFCFCFPVFVTHQMSWVSDISAMLQKLQSHIMSRLELFWQFIIFSLGIFCEKKCYISHTVPS